MLGKTGVPGCPKWAGAVSQKIFNDFRECPKCPVCPVIWKQPQRFLKIFENGFQKNFSRVRALILMGHWGHTSNTYLLILIFIIK